MNKLITKPITISAIVAGLVVFNIVGFAQAPTGAAEAQAIEFILKVIGGVTLLIITAVNVWAAIKNKNYADIKEAYDIQKKLGESLKLEIAEIQKDKAEEVALRVQAEREVKRKDRLLEETEQENLRLLGQLKPKGER